MLICDSAGARTRGIPISGSPRGPNKDSPPASGPRLGRSWRGAARPRPPGLRSLARLRAPGPCCLGHPAGGVPGTGATVAGWATACGCPCPTPSPWRFSGFWRNSAWAVPWHGGVRGRAPVVGRRWATRPRRWAARCSRLRLCPPSTDWARLSTGDRATGHTCLVEL